MPELADLCLPGELCMGGRRYNLSSMYAAEFLPDVRAVLDERNEPSYRIRQIYKALTGALVRDWREATNLPRELQAALSEVAPAAALALERVSNVVVMGMGEPMLNYDATLGALRVLNDPDGFGLAARHIAVSTSGLVEKVRRFAEEPEQFHLAISLHTPFEEERRQIMPVAARHTITELMGAAGYFVARTRRKLFFEYTLLAGVNDQSRHVEALSDLLDHPLYHLNLLRFNWTDTGFAATPTREAKQFLRYARELGLSVTLRPGRGQDIDAACGQLAAKDLRGRPAVHMV